MASSATLTRPDGSSASKMDAETPVVTQSSDVKEKNPKYAVPFDDSQIVKYGEAKSDVLRRIAVEIRFVDGDIRALIADMAGLMYQAHGVGLAAPQVGKSIRLLVYDAGDGLQVLINPLIQKSKGEQYEPEEGCLSIPGLRGVVRRAQEITVRALDGEGRPVRFRTTGFEARVIQHELDHLNGVLFIDLADPATLHMLTAEEREEEMRETAGEDALVPPAE